MSIAAVVAGMVGVIDQSPTTVDDYISSLPPEVVTTTVKPPAREITLQSHIQRSTEESQDTQDTSTADSGDSETPETQGSPAQAPATPARSGSSPRSGSIPGVSKEDEARFDKLASCESGNNWAINTGNGFHGGLQFLPSTWNAFKQGTSAANVSYAYQATREQQIEVAGKVKASQGWGAWPACSRKYGFL